MDPAEIIRIKNLLPTDLGSDEVREQRAADILRRSIFSARMEDLRHLAVIRDVCADVVSGAINQATARERLLASLARMGHSPLDGGGISNPASIKRLDLIIDTQRQMAASVAKIAAETPATLEEWPAQELTRFVGRAAPRADWHARWQAAGDSVGWEGAAKDAGGFPDWRRSATARAATGTRSATRSRRSPTEAASPGRTSRATRRSNSGSSSLTSRCPRRRPPPSPRPKRTSPTRSRVSASTTIFSATLQGDCNAA